MANDSVNMFHVDSVFPLSSEETTVTGHVAKGAFRPGESVSLISGSGIPLLAPISRIGSAETPINIVREGQKTSMLLRLEPHHLAPGSVLTGTGNDEAYAATMIVEGGKGTQAARTDPELQQIEQQVNARKFQEAFDALQARLAKGAGNATAHRLFARVHLEAEHELNDKKKALEHIKKAYEWGGAGDSAVLETLAQALGANGEIEHGLRFLERLHALASEGDTARYYSERIASYRKRFRVPDLWEFFDGFGDVVFQASKLDEIKKAIANGSIPKNANCRRNKTGDMKSMTEYVGKLHPEVLGGGKSNASSARKSIAIVAGGVIGLSAGIAFGMTNVLALSPFLLAIGGAGVGAGAVWGFSRMGTKKS